MPPRMRLCAPGIIASLPRISASMSAWLTLARLPGDQPHGDRTAVEVIPARDGIERLGNARIDVGLQDLFDLNDLPVGVVQAGPVRPLDPDRHPAAILGWHQFLAQIVIDQQQRPRRAAWPPRW